VEKMMAQEQQKLKQKQWERKIAFTKQFEDTKLKKTAANEQLKLKIHYPLL
jgi:hypothetical protein